MGLILNNWPKQIKMTMLLLREQVAENFRRPQFLVRWRVFLNGVL